MFHQVISTLDAGRHKLAAHAERLVAATFASIAGVALLTGCTVQLARVHGLSMAPTLQDRDRLVVDRLTYHVGKPIPGDIVMFHVPLDHEQLFVKRIVAQESDRVWIKAGRVYVNGRPLEDSYVPSEFRSDEDWGPYTVPPDNYLVLGDHRNRSSDSRHWGPVPRDAIVGRVQARWWPLTEAAMF
jgi:signal peptidase I